MNAVRVKRILLQDEIESLRAIDRLFERGSISFIQMGEAKATIKYRYFENDGNGVRENIRAWKEMRHEWRSVELALLRGERELPEVDDTWMEYEKEFREAFVNTDAWKRNQRVNA